MIVHSFIDIPRRLSPPSILGLLVVNYETVFYLAQIRKSGIKVPDFLIRSVPVPKRSFQAAGVTGRCAVHFSVTGVYQIYYSQSNLFYFGGRLSATRRLFLR